MKKAFAFIIRYDAADRCELLVLKLKSVGYEFYRLPGGNIEAGETPLQAAHRETFRKSQGSKTCSSFARSARHDTSNRIFNRKWKGRITCSRPIAIYRTKWEHIGTVGPEAGVVFALFMDLRRFHIEGGSGTAHLSDAGPHPGTFSGAAVTWPDARFLDHFFFSTRTDNSCMELRSGRVVIEFGTT